MWGSSGRTGLAWTQTLRETCGKTQGTTRRMRMSREEMRPKDEILRHLKVVS